jgi:hypothetical protein
MPHVGRGHRDILGETSIAVDADDLRMRADVRVSGAAQKAAAVYDVTLCSDAIALLHIGHECSNLNDIACEFMTDDEWRLASRARPVIPVVNVNVGAAHPRATNANQYFIVADSRLGNITQHESGTSFFFNECFHFSAVLCMNGKLIKSVQSAVSTAWCSAFCELIADELMLQIADISEARRMLDFIFFVEILIAFKK